MPEYTSDYKPDLDEGGVVSAIRESQESLSGFLAHTNGLPKEILIMREQGGIGDILNTRMLFEDIKKRCGNKIKVTYAVPPQFQPLLTDHPYIDNVISMHDVVKNKYGFFRNITDKCGLYENSKVPFVDKHRSDIWADYIGLELNNYNMHLTLGKDEIKQAQKLMGKADLKIGIQPVSSSPSKDWSLIKWQKLIRLIKSAYKGAKIFYYHNEPLGLTGVKGLYALNYREFMASVNECDIVITVATAMFCLANGLHKPTVAIFGCEDLDIYGRYFPEMIPIQRHRKHRDGWDKCPCWQAGANCPDCHRKGQAKTADKNTVPPCLDSITVDEVMKGVADAYAKIRQ